MKKLLLILLCLPMIGFGQTYVPDDNFEQALINLGYDNVLDDYVNTASIDTVIYLDLLNNWNGLGIVDLTGIEGFTALVVLDCRENQLTSLDVSANISLEWLLCSSNQLTSLDVSANTALIELHCDNNQLTTLDVSANTALTELHCDNNQLTTLDVSQNTALTELDCSYNQLTCLDVSNNTALCCNIAGPGGQGGIDLNCSNNLLEQLNTKNGNWVNGVTIFATTNNLICVEVDNIGYATANWAGSFDSFVTFNTNCNYASPCNPSTSIQEHTTNKELLKVTDLLGRETKGTNQPLFYIYDDGTVEKRIVIE